MSYDFLNIFHFSTENIFKKIVFSSIIHLNDFRQINDISACDMINKSTG